MRIRFDPVLAMQGVAVTAEAASALATSALSQLVVAAAQQVHMALATMEPREAREDPATMVSEVPVVLQVTVMRAVSTV